MRSWKSTFILGLVVCVLGAPGTASAQGAEAWNGVLIAQASVSFDSDPPLLRIIGNNFAGGEEPEVYLSYWGQPLYVREYDNGEIIAELPSYVTTPGDYLLRVLVPEAPPCDDSYALADPPSDYDVFVVTIGAVGPQGPPGLPGEPGPPGLSGLEFVYQQFGRVVGVNDTMVVSVACPSGKVAITGAYTLMPDTSSLPLYEGYEKFVMTVNQPSGEDTWSFHWRNMDSVGHYFGGVARAGCAYVE